MNNAGVYDDAPMAGMRADQWSHVIAVSLGGFFNVTQPVAPSDDRHAVGTGSSRFVGLGLVGNRGQTNYAAAKAGLQAPQITYRGRFPWRDRQCESVAASSSATVEDELQTGKDRGSVR